VTLRLTHDLENLISSSFASSTPITKVWWNYSSNFQDNAIARPKSAFFSMLEPTVTTNFDLLTTKVEAFILSQNAPMLKVW